MISQVFSVRGATTILHNSIVEITEKTIELITKIIDVNNLTDENFSIINIVASTTSDVTAFYPVRAIRECGICNAPLFSCVEPPIDNSLPMCIRLMVMVSSKLDKDVSPKHIYLHRASILRKDITGDKN